MQKMDIEAIMEDVDRSQKKDSGENQNQKEEIKEEMQVAQDTASWKQEDIEGELPSACMSCARCLRREQNMQVMSESAAKADMRMNELLEKLKRMTEELDQFISQASQMPTNIQPAEASQMPTNIQPAEARYILAKKDIR